MSIELMAQIFKGAREVKAESRLVLLAMADYADDDGFCWPKTSSVAFKANLTPKACTDIMNRLVEQRYLKLIKRGGGRGNASRYQVFSHPFKATQDAISSTVEEIKGVSGRGVLDDVEPINPPLKTPLLETPLLETPLLETPLSQGGTLKDEPSVHQPSLSTLDHIESIYRAYPRHVAKPPAMKAIGKALDRLTQGKDSVDENVDKASLKNRDVAAAWLLARTEVFAASPAGQQGNFTPHPATWFNAARYTESDSEWGMSNGTAAATPRNRDERENDKWRRLFAIGNSLAADVERERIAKASVVGNDIGRPVDSNSHAGPLPISSYARSRGLTI